MEKKIFLGILLVSLSASYLGCFGNLVDSKDNDNTQSSLSGPLATLLNIDLAPPAKAAAAGGTIAPAGSTDQLGHRLAAASAHSLSSGIEVNPCDMAVRSFAIRNVNKELGLSLAAIYLQLCNLRSQAAIQQAARSGSQYDKEELSSYRKAALDSLTAATSLTDFRKELELLSVFGPISTQEAATLLAKAKTLDNSVSSLASLSPGIGLYGTGEALNADMNFYGGVLRSGVDQFHIVSWTETKAYAYVKAKWTANNAVTPIRVTFMRDLGDTEDRIRVYLMSDRSKDFYSLVLTRSSSGVEVLAYAQYGENQDDQGRKYSYYVSSRSHIGNKLSGTEDTYPLSAWILSLQDKGKPHDLSMQDRYYKLRFPSLGLSKSYTSRLIFSGASAVADKLRGGEGFIQSSDLSVLPTFWKRFDRAAAATAGFSVLNAGNLDANLQKIPHAFFEEGTSYTRAQFASSNALNSLLEATRKASSVGPQKAYISLF